MHMSIRWKIYYGDGSIYIPGDPFSAPSRNVQAIINHDADHEWALVNNFDYYWYDEDRDKWNGGDLFGLYDYLLQSGHKKVVFGRTLDDIHYQDILIKIMNDPDIPKKTGFRPGEIK